MLCIRLPVALTPFSRADCFSLSIMTCATPTIASPSTEPPMPAVASSIPIRGSNSSNRAKSALLIFIAPGGGIEPPSSIFELPIQWRSWQPVKAYGNVTFYTLTRQGRSPTYKSRKKKCPFFRAVNLKPCKGWCQVFVVRTGFEPVSLPTCVV